MPLTPGAAARRLSTSIAFRVRGELAPLLAQHSGDIAARLEGVDRRLDEIERHQHTLGSVNDRLGSIETSVLETLSQLRADVIELKRLAETSLELESEKTELFGRLLRSATSRLDELEERLSDAR